MSIAEKLTTIAENEKKVYDAGKAVGVQEGIQTEYDRFWDTFQENGNRKVYHFAFAGSGWNQELLKPKYQPIRLEGAYGNHIFNHLAWIDLGGINRKQVDFTELSKIFDFSQCTNCTSIFDNAIAKNITVDFSNATNVTRAFAGGDNGWLDNITVKVSEKCTNMGSMFYHQGSLETLIFTEDSVINATNLDLSHSKSLSKASILSIFNALSTTATGKSAKISLTAVNNAFETAEGLADGSTSDEWNALVASRSNWTISLADT